MHLGYSSYNIFDDWLDIMLYALMRNDDKYLEVVNTYRNHEYAEGSRPIDYFARAFALLLNLMKETNDEILGELYQQWNMANKRTGQFFTPKQIAKMMAMILEPQGECISDPCCGAGIMLIEACKVIDAEQLNKAIFIGQDIDLTCVRMCALNLVCFNLNGYIIHGNTLANECLRVYQTCRGAIGGSIRELNKEEVEIIKEKLKIIVIKEESSQLSIF